MLGRFRVGSSIGLLSLPGGRNRTHSGIIFLGSWVMDPISGSGLKNGWGVALVKSLFPALADLALKSILLLKSKVT